MSIPNPRKLSRVALISALSLAASCSPAPAGVEGTEGGAEDVSDDPTDSSRATSGDDSSDVSGFVTRSTPPDAGLGGDGRGDLHLFLSSECVTDGGGKGSIAAELRIEGADLSAEGAKVPFTFEGVRDGSYFLTGFLDDIPSSGSEDAVPQRGDLVSFGDMAPRCVPVAVDGASVSGAVLDLNFVMPFDLPTQMDTETEDAPAETDGSAPAPGTDEALHTVSGEIGRKAAPAFGGDGVGPLYVVLSKKCMSTTGDAASTVAYAVIDGADLSTEGSTVPFTLEGVPSGTYQLNGFLDDVTNATAEKPLPGKGDLVSFGGFGPKCLKVVVDGADVSGLSFTLNMAMSFDLPG